MKMLSKLQENILISDANKAIARILKNRKFKAGQWVTWDEEESLMVIDSVYTFQDAKWVLHMTQLPLFINSKGIFLLCVPKAENGRTAGWMPEDRLKLDTVKVIRSEFNSDLEKLINED